MEIENFTIPQIYLPPTGGPLYWRNEQSGVLPAAIWAYLNHTASASQQKLVADYLEYYIHAPCWDIWDNAFAEELEELRQSSKNLKTKEEIHDWIFKALEIGIYPL